MQGPVGQAGRLSDAGKCGCFLEAPPPEALQERPALRMLQRGWELQETISAR